MLGTIPDTWINTAIHDEKDSEVSCEISFNHYFRKYEPLRLLEETEVGISREWSEGWIIEMMKGVAS